MRRRTLLVALAALAVVVAVGVVVLWPRQEPNRITRENCYRIKEGMSWAEVEAILGPPGDYSTGDAKCSDLPAPPNLMDLRRALSLEEWIGDRATMRVFFDGAGNVAYAECRLLEPVDRGPLGNLLWRAKRQWHRWFP
jgi:hypothetical protein